MKYKQYVDVYLGFIRYIDIVCVSHRDSIIDRAYPVDMSLVFMS